MRENLLPILIISSLILMSTVFSAFAYASSETISLNPIADSYVEEYEPNSNHGGASTLEVANSTNMFVLCDEAYLMFNLSAIPSGATIESATFQVYTSMITETHIIGAHYCADNSWSEMGITWINKPTYSNSASDIQTVGRQNTWYNWTVSNDVKGALGAKKITFVLKSETPHDTAWVWFYSRDQTYSWMQQYEPVLTVTYSISNSNPSSSGIPSFPWESVMIGGIVGLTLVYLLRKRRFLSNSSKFQPKSVKF